MRSALAWVAAAAAVATCAHAAPAPLVAVPFVGCASDGQVGPLPAPQGMPKYVAVDPGVAAGLAYYMSGQGVGVLAPRGWHCLSVYGSGGHTLLVRPERIAYGDWDAAPGPEVRVSYTHGDTSGRFTVAEVIARLFPSYRSFSDAVQRELGQEKHPFPRRPYPADVLTYRTTRAVEYHTPAGAEGLGRQFGNSKSPRAVQGVAMLIGKTPDLLVLAISLSPQQHALTTPITLQMERDGARVRSE